MSKQTCNLTADEKTQLKEYAKHTDAEKQMFLRLSKSFEISKEELSSEYKEIVG